MIYFCLAASKIRFVIVSGCDMRETWLAFTSIVFAPMRFAIKRWRFGGYLKQKAAKILIQRLPVRTPTPNGSARKSQTGVSWKYAKLPYRRFHAKWPQTFAQLTEMLKPVPGLNLIFESKTTTADAASWWL